MRTSEHHWRCNFSVENSAIPFTDQTVVCSLSYFEAVSTTKVIMASFLV
jgi:hypothetical protein